MKTFLLVLSLVAGTAVAQKQQPPIMGWSSWNTYRVHISDSIIRSQADNMVALGLNRYGYNYINIDDGFFGYRDAQGVMHTHPQRFPNGLKGTIDYIHSLGLKAGIYSDAGAWTCGSIWDKDKNGIGSGLYGHEIEDAKLYFNDWGCDFIKIDYCGAGQELDLDEQQRYTRIKEVIDSVAQRPISVNICRWAFPGTWAARLATSWRISGDITNKWWSVKQIVNKNMYLSGFARDGHFNDMDMLEVGRGFPYNEEELHFGMWCIMSSPLLIGCDLKKIPEQTLKLITNPELIALNQDTLGLQAYVVKNVGDGRIFVKDIIQRHGTTRAVALYNPSDTALTFTLNFADIDLAGRVRLRNLATRRDIPARETNRGAYTTTVAAHSAIFLKAEGKQRLEPVRYEAEWAYLPDYNDLGKRKKEIHFQNDSTASGAMMVSHIGGSPMNTLEWHDVWSNEGGRYTLTLHCKARPYARLQVRVNDRLYQYDRLPEGKGMQTIRMEVTLRKGSNKVVVGHPTFLTPDMDYMEVTPLRADK